MNGSGSQGKPHGRLGLAAVGAGALVVACCAGFPIAVAALGAVSGGALFGVGVGTAIAVVGLVAILLRMKWKRRSAGRGEDGCR